MSKISEILHEHFKKGNFEEAEKSLSELIVPSKKKNIDTRIYSATKEGKFANKTPLQMQQCVNALKAANTELTLETWAEKLVGVISTKQTLERILKFYLKRMIAEGLITEPRFPKVNKVSEVSEVSEQST